MTQRLSFRAANRMTLVLLFFLVGCSSPPTRFFALNALDYSKIQGEDVKLGVGPIVFPNYLDRPQIVIRGEGGELELSEFNQWAESIEESFIHSLAENLAAAVPAERIMTFPWRRTVDLQYQVIARVNRFEATTAGEAVLQVRWGIVSVETGEILVAKLSSYSQEADIKDYQSIVTALSNTVLDFSRDVASTIRSLRG